MEPMSDGTFGARAAKAVDNQRGVVADGLDRAAGELRDAADRLPEEGTPSAFAQQAADRLKSASDYVRDRPVSDMLGDIQAWVKHNPGPSLLVAGMVGFAIGRTLRRD